jgi:hypothetical protein
MRQEAAGGLDVFRVPQAEDCTTVVQGCATEIARRYFWDACDTFSMNFACLVSDEGVKFRKELQADVRAAEMRQEAAGGLDVFRVPQAEDCTTVVQGCISSYPEYDTKLAPRLSA